MRFTREQADDLRLRKPDLFSDAPQQPLTSPLREGGAAGKPVAAVGACRIRQDTKPLMNKLEAAWLSEVLKRTNPSARPQALKFRLGNGIAYKPDFVDFTGETVTCWEVKGPHAFRGGFENLKVAAAAYPEIRWVLVWKVAGEWQQQVVLP